MSRVVTDFSGRNADDRAKTQSRFSHIAVSRKVMSRARTRPGLSRRQLRMGAASDLFGTVPVHGECKIQSVVS